MLGRIQDELHFSPQENEEPANPDQSSHPSCGLLDSPKNLEACHQFGRPPNVVNLKLAYFFLLMV